MGRYDEQKKIVHQCIMDLVDRGFIQGSGGSVSMLIEDENAIAVTPSQKDYSCVIADDICVVDFDLKPVDDNGHRPSVESGMHIEIYRNRRDVNAVVHTRQAYASIFSLINQPIPAIFDEVSNSIGNTVEVIPYGLSGSPQLLENVTEKLESRCNCYIIQNHGALSLGTDMETAKRNAELLEKSAMIYYCALTTGCEITTLPREVQDLLSKLLKGRQDSEINRKSLKAKNFSV